MLAGASRFHCVVIDKDADADLAKRFNVSSFPTVVVLNDKEQNIHRWSGFSSASYFVKQLDVAMERFELCKAGKEWDIPQDRPAKLADTGECRLFQTPLDDAVAGLTMAAGYLWCHQRDPKNSQATFFQVEPGMGAKPGSREIPSMDVQRVIRMEGEGLVVDICSDNVFLYAIDYGWTAGKPIYKIDLETGAFEAPIVTEANKAGKAYATSGLAWRDGALYVLHDRSTIRRVDPQTGEAGKKIAITLPEFTLFGASSLDFDGECFVTTASMQAGKPANGIMDREQPVLYALLRIDPETGAVVERLPLHYPLRGVACADCSYYLAEQSHTGFGKDHQTVRLSPNPMVIHRWTPERKSAPSEK